MNQRKLTKEDLDKVRDIEGFPIASDEDIINLSEAPYYTACPNPYLEEFVKENGTIYDEATDDYHCEPFAADVSEGKYDPLYKLHAYPTKVPPKAIEKYIKHYTNPGDIVLDCFCGTGMTGIAAQSCGINRNGFFQDPIHDGARKAVLLDLSPTATFISHNYNAYINTKAFFEYAEKLLEQAEHELGWMNETYDDSGNTVGTVNYIVWSRKYCCPHCGSVFSLWDVTVDYDFDKAIGKVADKFKCDKCNAELTIKDVVAVKKPYFDVVLNRSIEAVENIPVLINYEDYSGRYEKKPSKKDFELCEKILHECVKGDVPSREIPFMHETHQRRNWATIGATHEHHMYTHKTLVCYSRLFELAKSIPEEYADRFRFLLTSCFNRTTKLVRYMAQHKEKNVGPLSGTLYTTSIFGEINPFVVLKSRLQKMKKAYSEDEVEQFNTRNVIISTQSSSDIRISDNSVDYVFVDPPFGDNLMYSELNYFTDMWLKVYENNTKEAIINKAQKKEIFEYQQLMTECFSELYRVLKPNRWITIEFHNSKNAVWNALQQTVQKAGFIIADVRTLDKKKGTTKQMSYTSTVKQDLVISAYKPREKFRRVFLESAGSEDTVWAFVAQHLSNLPVVVDSDNDGRIDIIDERMPYLLFDRMVAYHIMNGLPVPLSAVDFYHGLDEHYILRDGMYFLPDQVNQYDTARIKMDVENIQFELFVTNEKSAIAWLYQVLFNPQTYAEIQPKFMQEVKTVDKYEEIPELAVLLEENFIQDDKGRWYIPDVSKEGDVAKLREKKLWKEFEGYLNSKGKLKLFRSEAIRIGFARLWKDKNYKAIVDIAERLPEQTIQEDQNLLMYYDISLGRV